MIEIKWACIECDHEQIGYCDAYFTLDLRKGGNVLGFDGFVLKCEKCGRDTEFDFAVTRYDLPECSGGKE